MTRCPHVATAALLHRACRRTTKTGTGVNSAEVLGQPQHPMGTRHEAQGRRCKAHARFPHLVATNMCVTYLLLPLSNLLAWPNLHEQLHTSSYVLWCASWTVPSSTCPRLKSPLMSRVHFRAVFTELSCELVSLAFAFQVPNEKPNLPAAPRAPRRARIGHSEPAHERGTATCSHIAADRQATQAQYMLTMYKTFSLTWSARVMAHTNSLSLPRRIHAMTRREMDCVILVSTPTVYNEDTI